MKLGWFKSTIGPGLKSFENRPILDLNPKLPLASTPTVELTNETAAKERFYEIYAYKISCIYDYPKYPTPHADYPKYPNPHTDYPKARDHSTATHLFHLPSRRDNRRHDRDRSRSRSRDRGGRYVNR